MTLMFGALADVTLSTLAAEMFFRAARRSAQPSGEKRPMRRCA
jgi:hypothetical protein